MNFKWDIIAIKIITLTKTTLFQCLRIDMGKSQKVGRIEIMT